MQQIENKIIKNKKLKEDYQRALKKLTLFFLFFPIPFNKQDHKKRSLKLVTSHSSGYKIRSEKSLD